MHNVRFLHIPKTAGSTFEQILARQYIRVGHFGFNGDSAADIARFMNLPDDEKANIGLFTGHAPITTGIGQADNGIIITFLRNPISRVKSFCQHVAEGKSPYLRKDFPPESFNLDSFLNSGNPELSNLQAKMLINNLDCASSALIERLSLSEARDMALENLFSKISYFGLQEYFDESLILFADALKWAIPLYSSKNKKSSDKFIEFKEYHLDLISKLNSIDIDVYNTAVPRFFSTLEKINAFSIKLLGFRTIQNLKRH